MSLVSKVGSDFDSIPELNERLFPHGREGIEDLVKKIGKRCFKDNFFPLAPSSTSTSTSDDKIPSLFDSCIKKIIKTSLSQTSDRSNKSLLEEFKIPLVEELLLRCHSLKEWLKIIGILSPQNRRKWSKEINFSAGMIMKKMIGDDNMLVDFKSRFEDLMGFLVSQASKKERKDLWNFMSNNKMIPLRLRPYFLLKTFFQKIIDVINFFEKKLGEKGFGLLSYGLVAIISTILSVCFFIYIFKIPFFLNISFIVSNALTLFQVYIFMLYTQLSSYVCFFNLYLFLRSFRSEVLVFSQMEDDFEYGLKTKILALFVLICFFIGHLFIMISFFNLFIFALMVETMLLLSLIFLIYLNNFIGSFDKNDEEKLFIRGIKNILSKFIKFLDKRFFHKVICAQYSLSK